MKTLIITQARMNSTRLPGKILKAILGKSLLEYQLERLRHCFVDDIIVATTTDSSDDVTVRLCEYLNVKVFRGSQDDVLSRFFFAALENKADVIIRVTADCPLIDPWVINYGLQVYQKDIREDQYVSNVMERSYPRGLDTEIFSFKLLKEAYINAIKPSEREHVTPFMHLNAKLVHFINPQNYSTHRWTVDYEQDLELVSNVLTKLYPLKPNFNFSDVLALLELYPEWGSLNSHVEQKAI